MEKDNDFNACTINNLSSFFHSCAQRAVWVKAKSYYYDCDALRHESSVCLPTFMVHKGLLTAHNEYLMFPVPVLLN